MACLTQKILPRLLPSKPDGKALRVWVPACATGQEAYSIAMLLMETPAVTRTAMPVQIFATDLDEKALAKARSGIYTREEVEGLGSLRVKKFFQQTDGGYRVADPIRNCCIFSKHNLFRDPPFGQIDLISAPNMPAALENDTRKHVLSSFYLSLASNGFLLLGREQAASDGPKFFSAFNTKLGIYKKSANTSSNDLVAMRYRLAAAGRGTVPMTIDNSGDHTAKDKTITELVDAILLKSFVPACIVVNKKMDILQFRGDTGIFLEPPEGTASLNLRKIARTPIGYEVKKAILEISRRQQPHVKKAVELDSGETMITADIEVLPLPDGGSAGQSAGRSPGQSAGRSPGRPPGGSPARPAETFLVILRQAPAAGSMAARPGRRSARARDLQAQLSNAREEIRFAVEDQKDINEELQSANEEVAAANEELQSINDSLTAAKAEVEFTNERLMTANSDLNHRNLELAEAREYSDTVISMMNEAVVLLNGDFTVKMANQTFYDLFQLRTQETIGSAFFRIGNGQWQLPELQGLLEAVASGRHSPKPLQLRVSFRGLGERSLIINAKRVKKNSGTERLIFVAIEDVTRKAAADKIIAERETWFQNIADQTPALIWVADHHRQRTFFNRTWLEFTGRSLQQELGDGWIAGMHPDDRQAYLEVYVNGFATQTPFQHEYRLRRHDGQYRWIRASGRPMYSPDGTFSGFLGACNEIHEQRMANEELEKEVESRTRELSQALAREQELNEMKSRFVTIASHEFRTPLTAILSSVSLLEKYSPEQFGASGPKHLGRIKSSIGILKEILGDFLSVERLEENKVEVHRENIDIYEEIKDIEETARGILKPDQNIWYTHTGKPEGFSDKKILRNILINLLSNASKFSPPGSEIRLESRHVNGTIEISVADKGIGISKEDQEKLFERFFRASNAGNTQGTGLGLNIVKRYVELLGGSIRLTSELNRGSSFAIEIPDKS